MNALERCFIRLRHHPILEKSPVWGIVRPFYDLAVTSIAHKNGLERILNGTDRIRIAPRWRGLQETYEPSVWGHLMSQVTGNDVIVDVGAFIGLYTIALAKRVGPPGHVVAFEPEPSTFAWLQRHVALNEVGNKVKLVCAAVGDQVGKIRFSEGLELQSHVAADGETGRAVTATTLDAEFPQERVDLLKIDVEGYEEKVLLGGARLLKDVARSPRMIYIEVHPYAWKELGTTGESLLGLLKEYGYRVSDLEGQPVQKIDRYGEIIARKNS